MQQARMSTLKDLAFSDCKSYDREYYGAGIQACYRGPRLYDTEQTKNTVIEIIDWYKEYRNILNADIIRLRRADGRDWDGWMHVNPRGEEKALIMLFNPLDVPIKRSIEIPLYYTGLSNQAQVSDQYGPSEIYEMGNGNSITLEVEIPANYLTWLTVK